MPQLQYETIIAMECWNKIVVLPFTSLNSTYFYLQKIKPGYWL